MQALRSKQLAWWGTYMDRHATYQHLNLYQNRNAFINDGFPLSIHEIGKGLRRLRNRLPGQARLAIVTCACLSHNLVEVAQGAARTPLERRLSKQT